MVPGLAVDIVDLGDCPQWLDQVALWHHEEWRRHQPSSPIHSATGTSFQKRLKLLESHLRSTSIPVTFLAVLNGEPIGSTSVVFYQFSRNQARSPWLTNVYVCPEYRARGLGTALIDHACKHAKVHGVEKLMLYTHDQTNYYLNRDWQEVRIGHLQRRPVTILEKLLV